jgi:pantetheine-phosphate adenylyltransferase
VDQRKKWIEDVFRDELRITVDVFEGLTVHYCKKVDAKFLIRGLRNASDFDYEKTISQLNHIVGGNVETVFLISKPEFSHISSTIVREIIKGKGDASPFFTGGSEVLILDFGIWILDFEIEIVGFGISLGSVVENYG